MTTHQKTLYWLAFADGCALLLLVFIAVPVKYLLDLPLGVKLLGPLHGGLFISLTLTTVAALSRKVVKPGHAHHHDLQPLRALLALGAGDAHLPAAVHGFAIHGLHNQPV